MRKKTIIPDIKFVAIGKDYQSKERAEIRSQELLKKGYKCTFSNGKRKTFTKAN